MPTENKPADPKPTGLSQGWNLTRKHDGFVVGHQSVAYPPDQKAIERAERDGYVWVPFLVPAARTQVEPVVWRYRKSWEKDGWVTCKKHPTDYGIDEDCYTIQALYAEQPAPVAVVMPERKAVAALVTMAARHADLIPGANYHTAAELAADAVIYEITRLNPSL